MAFLFFMTTNQIPANPLAEFTASLENRLARLLLIAPDSHVSPSIKREAQEYFANHTSLAQRFDFYAAIAQRPEPEISNFVKTAYNLPKYYLRPTE